MEKFWSGVTAGAAFMAVVSIPITLINGNNCQYQRSVNRLQSHDTSLVKKERPKQIPIQPK